MDFAGYFPIWTQLGTAEQEQLLTSLTRRKVKKGTLLRSGEADCLGLFVIHSGQLRAYILSEAGKEVTLYRLFERDICLFSASCAISSIQFEILVEAEKDTDLWIIPADFYQQLREQSVTVANYTNQVMASRFSEVMWLMNQIMFKSFDARLATFLLQENTIQGSDRLAITHEKIANHLGTAREVVTRMLKYFQTEGLVELARGRILLLDHTRIAALSR